MVRTTIACAFCRKLKIKCVHEGLPPCRNCLKKGRDRAGECVLSGPELSKHRSNAFSQKRISRESVQNSSSDTRPNQDRMWRLERNSSDGQRDILFKATLSDISQACSIFNRKFPELRFLHLPTILKSVRFLERTDEEHERTSSKVHLLSASIVALSIPWMTNKNDLPSADTITAQIHDRIPKVEPPDLIVVQTFLVLTMYEWGVGNGYRAWMTSGTALRMMQALLVMKPSMIQSDMNLQIYNRTLWGCFIIDRLVFCGRPQPATISYASLHTFWPTSEEDFVFGQPPAESSSIDLENRPARDLQVTMREHYCALVQGFDIWARILRWVVSGGRRQPGMCLPENHPWIETSPWRCLYDELESWRNRQESRMLFPKYSVGAHAALGQAEPFAYINLIYYLSMLFLNREYLPFLPTMCCEYSGPIDPPLLLLDPPTGWWHDRAEELFNSAIQISTLMEDLDDADASLATPFPGFCLFSAATMNLYAAAFPWMNPSHNLEVMKTAARNLSLLDSFRRIWPIGEGWWITTQQCKRLYEQHERFRGRTRADFSELDYSIHDCGGQAPKSDEVPQRGSSVHRNERQIHADHCAPAAVTLDTHNELVAPTGTTDITSLPDDWSQLWPLWSEQSNTPFEVEDFPFGSGLD